MNKILFLCTGNYYRSRYAELIFNWHATPIIANWKATSRGLDLVKGANNVGPISPAVSERLIQKGIPFSSAMIRPPIQAKQSDLKDSKLIVALQDSEHRYYIQKLFPDWENQVIFWNIPDVAPDIFYDPLHEIEVNIISLIDEITRK